MAKCPFLSLRPPAIRFRKKSNMAVSTGDANMLIQPQVRMVLERLDHMRELVTDCSGQVRQSRIFDR